MTYEKQLRIAKAKELLAWLVLISGIVTLSWCWWIGVLLALLGAYLSTTVSWPYPKYRIPK